MAINDRFIFTGGGDGGIRQWPLETTAKRNYFVCFKLINLVIVLYIQRDTECKEEEEVFFLLFCCQMILSFFEIVTSQNIDYNYDNES